MRALGLIPSTTKHKQTKKIKQAALKICKTSGKENTVEPYGYIYR